MSGSRAKASRRAFATKHGRRPHGTTVQKAPALGPTFRGKRAWVDHIWIAGQLMRKIFGVTIVEPSEWRREKKTGNEAEEIPESPE